MINFITNLKNKIDFFIRQNIRLSRKDYSEKNESKENIFDSTVQKEREIFLIKNYEISYLNENSTEENYIHNLYTLDLLDKYFVINTNEELRVLDIGCKNWFYAKGEYAFFKKHCESLTLDGIEIDGNRLYSNFYTRKEVAKFYIKDLTGCSYKVGDFLNHKEKYNYISWILPFVVKEPLLKWGLPIKYFKPEQMLVHAYESLRPEGKLFIVNQGEIEYEEQKQLCKRVGLSFEDIGNVNSVFIEDKYPRYAIIINK